MLSPVPKEALIACTKSTRSLCARRKSAYLKPQPILKNGQPSCLITVSSAITNEGLNAISSGWQRAVISSLFLGSQKKLSIGASSKFAFGISRLGGKEWG